MSAQGEAWRVPPKHTVIKAGGAVALLALAVFKAGDRAFLLLAGVAALALAGLALRDLLAPVRVAADSEGLTVISGFAGREHIPWAEVVDLKVDETRRLGLRARLLEIDTAEGPHLFSRYDLGAEPAEVLAMLARYRADLAPHEPGTESSH